MNKIQFLKGYGSRKWLYNHGAIGVLAGDWLAWLSEGTSLSDVSLSKGASALTLTITNAVGWAYSKNEIDLTNIKTLYFYGSSSHSDALLYFGISPDYALTTAYRQVQIPLNGASALVSLDVSAVTGNYFIRFGRFGETRTTTTVTCSEVYGV